MSLVQNRAINLSTILISLWASPALAIDSVDQLSFDCSKAKLKVELAICADPSLSRTEATIGQIFQQILATANNQDQIIADQRKWVAQRKRFCEAAPDTKLYECLENSAKLRSKQLNEVLERARKDVAEKNAREARERELAEDAGYDRISFDDYLLDAKELQRSGRKISIAGFYTKFGAIEELFQTFQEAIVSTSKIGTIFLLTEDSPRDLRGYLLHCGAHAAGNVCPVRVRGYVSTCQLTLLGSSASKPCLIVESGTQTGR